MVDGRIDGHIIFDTLIDTSGVVDAKKVIEKAVSSLSNSFKKIGQIDTSGVVNAQKVIEKSASSLSNSLKKIGQIALTAFSVRSIVNFSKQALAASSDLQEVQNVVEVAFGSMSDAVDKWAKTTVEKFGMSELKAKQFASTYAAMGKGMGLDNDKSAAMAIGATERIGDIASFYNKSFEEVDAMMKSIWTGETESLKRIGVVMTETNLKAFALSQGITQNYKDMDQATKTQLRYAYVMQQTALAQGDFIRTSDSWANQTRILSEQFNTLKISIGQGLIQALTPAINYINILMKKINQLAAKFSEFTAYLFGEQSLGGAASETAAATEDISSGINGAADAEKALGNEIDKTTKKQQRQLASFDRLNRLGSYDNKTGGSGNIDIGNIGAIQRSLGDVQKEFDKLEKDIDSNLVFTITNVLFKWEDLTEEDIAQKILTGFCALLGGIIGATIGGPQGAILGLTIGASLGLLLSSLTFDNDGKISKQEILKMVVLGLGAITGGIFGGLIAGPKGITGGVTLGLLLTAALNELTFDKNSDLSQVEIYKIITDGIGAIIGGAIGGLLFKGGIASKTGMTVGAIMGLSISVFLNDLIFDEDQSKIKKEDIANIIMTGIISLISGAIGFVIGGGSVPGAVIGLSLGVMISTSFIKLDFGERVTEGIKNFKLMGYRVNEGFKRGWEEGGIVGWFTQGFGNLIKKIKAFLGIHSPSTVFKEIGDNLVAGFFGGIKEKWKAVKEWWDKDIKAIFTKEFWDNKFINIKDSIKDFANGGISNIETFINAIINGLNKMIGALNSISVEIPDWVPKFGGKNIGFSIPTIKEVTLPKLASGTVVPANYGEFAAILGDNKRETEVVSPVSTMKQAFKEALEEMGFNNITIHNFLDLDGDIVFKNTVKKHNETVTRTGRTPFKGV